MTMTLTVPPPTAARGGPPIPRPTPRRTLDEMIARLAEGAAGFVRWPLSERLRLIGELRTAMLAEATAMVVASCEAKGIGSDGPLAGQEWATGPWPIVRQLRLLARSLEAIGHSGSTPLGPVSRRPNGQLVTTVFPTNRIDGVLFGGITTEARFLAEVPDALERRAAFYRHPGHDGRVVLVLGAGNMAAIASMDVLTKLFNEGKACLLKLSPVNAYLGPILERALGPAIRRNVVGIAYGGPDEGEYLVGHVGVSEIHLTGSDRTYERIVWGPPGPERERRKASRQPLVQKPVTAELGNVSPVIVVPGPYRPAELAFQAGSIAGAFTYNAAFSCCTPRVLVTPRGWAGRARLLEQLSASLEQCARRTAYYPGATEQWHALCAGRARLRTIGAAEGDELPWTLLPELDASDPREPAFRAESFCPALSETEVGSDDPVEFLERSVDFANNRLWGTLSADLVIHPSLFKDHRTAEAVERALDRLRYGVITVNSWTGNIFCQGAAPWGAYPTEDSQSGSGWVHNTLMLEGIEKVVLRHPLTLNPKPVTSAGHRTADQVMRRMTTLDAEARWRYVPGVIAAAVQG